MPMKPITVKANFQLDTSAARAQLQGLQKELNGITKNATSQLGVTQQITEAIKAAELLKQTLAEATNVNTGTLDLAKFTTSMKENMTSIEQMKKSLQTLGPEGEKAFNSLAMNIATAQVPLQRTSELFGQFKTAISNAMKWQVSSMAIHKVTAEISKAFNYAQNLDKSLTNISIVTGHNADYMAKFAQNANKAAQALSASTLEYTNASLIYYQQGLSDKEVAKRAETTLKLAKVTGESASKVSQQMTAVWNNFSNGVDNLERYADVMTALGATTASSSSEIAKGLEKFASVTKTIGLSYDYAASALATVTAQTRQSADTVGTSFKTLFSRLESLNLGETLDDATTLNKYSEALLKAGVNVMDVNGHLKDMDTILDELGAQWNNLNKAQQVALAQTVGGVRNYTSLITLMDNWEDFQNNVVTSQLAEGTLQKQADIYAKSWEAAQQRVTTAAQGIYDTLISSDFFKGVNNVTAFALNGLSGLGRALGTGGSLAGLSMLINSAYRENLATGVQNLGNNILANTAYGQKQALDVKNQLINDLSKDLKFRDGSLEQFRKDILDTANDNTQNFYKNRKSLPTRAAQQAYANMLMQTNAEGIQALNRLSAVDNFKAIDSKMLKATTSQKITGMSSAGRNYYVAAAERLLNNKDMQVSGRAVAEAFMTQFGKNMLLATEDPKVATQLKEQVEKFNAANTSILQGNGAMKGIIGAITGLKGDGTQTLAPSTYNLLSKYIAKETAKESIALDKAVKAEVEKAGYKLDSDEGKAQVKQLSGIVKEHYDTHGKWAAEEALARYTARSNADQSRNLIGTLKNMSTQPGGLLSVKQHYKLDSEGNPVIDKATGQRVMEDNTMAMGQFAMQTAQMVNSMAMAANSISNFKKSIDSGDVSFSNFAATLGSTGLAIGTTLNMMQNNSALLGFMGGATGKNIAGFLGKTPGIGKAFVSQEGGLSTLGGGLIAAAAAAALYAGIKGYEVYKANTIDSKISRANEDKITLNSLSKEDKQRYNTFLDVAQTQNENYGKLYNLQKNTSQYTSQLIDSNQQARDMIDTYSLKAGTDYSIDSQGAINFSAQQIANISERLLDQSQQTSMLAQLANSRITQLDAIKNNAYGIRTISRMNVSGGTGVGNGMGAGAVTIEEKSEEEYQEELKQAEQDQKEASAIAKADYQVALQSVVTADDNVTNLEKLAVDILGSNIANAEDYAKQLYNVSKAGGITRNLTGEYLDEASLRNIYMQDEYFGEAAAANMTQQELAAAIEAKAAENILKAQIESLSNLDASAVSKYSDYSSISVNRLLEEVIKPNQDDDNYRSLNLMALNKIAGSQETLAQALFNNTNISDMNFATMADKMQQELQLSVEQTENLANYINNFGTNFGDATGQAVLTALTGYDATTGKFGTGFNTDFYKELQNISTASSIASLADLEKRIGMIGNKEVADQMRDLQEAMMADIDSRGGLAKTLFESSDFQDTFTKLSDVFQATGHITAQNIADLAAKNETLNGYLQATAEQSPMSGAQAVADIASLLASGSITTSDLTPAIAAFIEEASGTGRGSQQEAIDEAEEARKNLSDSITDIDKFYQEGGKLWYSAIQNDALLDAPLQEWFAQVLKPEDLEAINTIFNLGVTKDTDWMVNQIKTKLPEVYDMMTVLQGGTSKKKAGKGGGGLDTYLAYLGSDSFLDAAGIKIEDNGRITFPGMPEGKSFEELYKEYMDQRYPDEETHYMTENGIYEFVNDYLLGQGMSKSQASFVATQFVGRSASSSLGTVYQRNGILAGTDKLIEQLEKENGGSVTRAGIDALYDQYAAGMAGLWINPETGNIEALSDEQLAAGQGGIDRDQFRVYIAQQLRDAGKAFIDASGLGMYGKSTDVQSIGKELADLSEGTIFGTGADAIVDAAVKYGVKRYRVQTPGQLSQMGNGAGLYESEPSQMLGEAFDYEELQDFYTNVLGLNIETFQQHLPDIMQSLANNSIYGGNGHAALNYQYKDIFGAVHNINSSDAKYWSGEEFNVEQYNQDINAEKQKSEWDDFQNQKFMEEAYEEAYENNQNPKNEYIDPYELYQQKIAAEKARRQAGAANTVNAYETNEPVNVEMLGKEPTVSQAEEIAEQEAQAAALAAYEKEQTVVVQQTEEIAEQEAQAAALAAYEKEQATIAQQAEQDAYNRWLGEGNFGSFEDFKNGTIPTTNNNYTYTRTGINHNPDIPEVVTDEQVENRAQWLMEHEGLDSETARNQALAEKAEMVSAAISARNESSNIIASGIDATAGITSTYGAETEPNLTTVDGWGTNNPFLADVQSLVLSTGESLKDFGQAVAYGFGALFGGTKASADYEIPGITMNGENPWGEKPEAITDDTYNPTLGMTFGEWKAQKAQQEQQLQQAQLEQEIQRQTWQNYQDALSAETDFLAGNSEFVTNPENARLAAWTAAARENPDLLGALYQNALKEGYTGDQFTAMYDYQGLQAEVQQSYQRYATAAWNGRNVTAQQRFDFLNQAYEKASMEGIDKLSPFEKQILTLVGEIDDSTGQLVEYGEENTTDAATRAKKNGQINEEGQLVDEEGNVIELPQNQQQQSTGGNTSGQGDITAGGQTQGKEKTTIFSNGMVRNNTTGQYAMPDGSGGWTVVDSPDKIDWDGNQARADSQFNIPGMDGKSSGQNNARLLAYASGKEGHIAITGELGPELRVKSDGSMDILGKTGREYAWVEPDDRIYTASQSAGILKSNKIPGLEGLAKGIHNFIPGYDGGVGGIVLNGYTSSDQGSSGSGSSSGGGSRGGGAPGEKDPRYDPNTLKIRDILERYYTILQQVDDITKAVEHIGKAIDRGWGQERIKNLERQEKLLESQYKMQEAYVKEIKDYLQVDKNALTTMVTDFVKEYNEGKNNADKINLTGALFDENGVLTNYKDIVDKLVSIYNKNAEANAQNKEEQYKFQERLKDIQMYTDTLNQLQEEEEKLYDLNNQILSTKIRQITYRIEYENELDANDLRLINYQYEKIGDNVFRDAELIDLLSQKATIGMGQVKRYGEGIFDIIGKYQDRVLTEAQKKQFFENPLAFAKEWQSMIASNPRFQDITDEDKTQLENYMDQMVTQMQGVEKYYNEAIKKIGDDIKTFGKMLDSTMDKFDYFDAVYKSMKNIADLTNRSLTKIDSQFMNTLSNASLNNSINKLAGARRILDTMRQEEKQTRENYEKELASGNQDAIDNMKKELDEVIKQHQEASKNVLSYWEDCLQKIQDTYKNTVEEAKRDFERMISPFYLTLEDLQNQYDREKKLGELYVKDYQRIHDLSKLNRDIQKSIDDTDNLKGKQNLRDLQEEILGLQEDGTELSEYDLNILEKRYNLELARQALEDARNAKSMVRLSRDNNGNWSYVYTSNQDDIDEAKQKYEDAIADMEKANEDYINDLQDQLTSLMREAEDELANLDLTGLTPEQITKKVEDTIKPYYTMWSFLSSQLQNAFGNNGLVLPYSQQMFAQQPNLTTTYGDTRFAKLTGNNDLGSFSNNFLNNLDWLGSKYIEAGITAYSEQQSRVYEIAKPVIEGSADIANMTEDLGNIISNSSDESDAWVTVVEQEATRAEGAFSDMLKALGEFQGKLGEVTSTAEDFQNILKSLNEFIKVAGNSIQPDDDPGYHWQYADTGMYTGEWPDGSSRRNGRLAWLHQKELVLNAHDTENFLDAMQIVRQLDNLTNWMANGLGDLIMPRVSSTEGELNQNVHIEAEFPNVTDHNEIEQAFGNLVNMASQYANRK